MTEPCSAAVIVCQPDDAYVFDLPPGYPEPRVPDDNPMNEAKVELGRVLPGDCNSDRALDISDPVCLLTMLFAGGTPELACGDGTLESPANVLYLDANGDAAVDVSDPIYFLSWLFTGGPEPFLSSACVAMPECRVICGE